MMSDCIEPYNFKIINDQPTLVVSSYISTVSYEETKNHPSSGRYFSVKLSLSNDVSNINDTPVSAAAPVLYDDAGNTWIYNEKPIGSGIYYLNDDNFKAEINKAYKLQIHLPDGVIYESDFERTNHVPTPDMGKVYFEETSKLSYKIEIGEKVIRSKKGIEVGIEVPTNESRESLFYRWNFEPTWIYTAPFASIAEPTYKCWISSKYYLNDYMLLEDNKGGYNRDLFFMETTRNNRIYEEISVLITQYSMTEGYFNFWKEMEEQTKKGKLFDAPPYNLETNFHCVNCDSKVSGYFGVVEEKATRLYFNRNDLSYFVENTNKADCSVPFQDPGPECFSCLAYPLGESTNVKPVWWQ